VARLLRLRPLDSSSLSVFSVSSSSCSNFCNRSLASLTPVHTYKIDMTS
jgi:hypothetical protein